MKSGELRAKTYQELQKLLDDSEKERFDLRVQLSSGQSVNNGRLRKIKRQIARILSVLAEKR